MNKEFLTLLVNAMRNYTSAKFELDNFDLLLLTQAITHLEKSPMA